MSAGVHVDPEVAAVRRLYAPLLDAAARRAPIRDHLARQAERLREAHEAGDASVRMPISSWHPRLVGRDAAAILAAPFDLDDAKLTVAREHGFRDWAEVAALGEQAPDEEFETAVDAELEGDLAALGALITASPDLVARRSEYGHRAGLLHYLAANGVESWRQVAPANACEILAALIAAGADVNAEVPIYGGSRPLGLLTSSAHPRAAGLTDQMAAALRAAGAH